MPDNLDLCLSFPVKVCAMIPPDPGKLLTTPESMKINAVYVKKIELLEPVRTIYLPGYV